MEELKDLTMRTVVTVDELCGEIEKELIEVLKEDVLGSYNVDKSTWDSYKNDVEFYRHKETGTLISPFYLSTPGINKSDYELTKCVELGVTCKGKIKSEK